MTNVDPRIQRINQLARRVWAEQDQPHFSEKGGHVGILGAYDMPLLTMPLRSRSVEALEAALCVLAGDTPSWVAELATTWRGEAYALVVDGEMDANSVAVSQGLADEYARELLEAAAKAGAR